MLNYNLVKKQIIYEYVCLYGSDRADEEWNLQACLEVFQYFYSKYQRAVGRDHPKLSSATIREIIENLPFSYDENGDRDITADYSPEDYPPMIDNYFLTKFPNCDYSMAHFMSGKIRLLRFYETLY